MHRNDCSKEGAERRRSANGRKVSGYAHFQPPPRNPSLTIPTLLSLRKASSASVDISFPSTSLINRHVARPGCGVPGAEAGAAPALGGVSSSKWQVQACIHLSCFWAQLPAQHIRAPSAFPSSGVYSSLQTHPALLQGPVDNPSTTLYIPLMHGLHSNRFGRASLPPAPLRWPKLLRSVKLASTRSRLAVVGLRCLGI